MIAAAMFVLPLFAFGQVRINEIAWMGTSQSSANEWIELYNASSTSIDLQGWTLQSSNGKLHVVLSGSIAPKSWYLIERTDDASVPGVHADLVASFGSGLPNGGVDLFLNDAHGVRMDTVVSGKNWITIGGDNTHKLTAQRTEHGWTTGQPTPRGENVKEEVNMSPEVSPAVTQPAPPVVSEQKAMSKKVSSAAQASRTLIAPAYAKTEERASYASSSRVVASSVPAQVIWSGDVESASRSHTWLLIGTGLALAICAGYLLMQSEAKETEADRYAIIEDIIEE